MAGSPIAAVGIVTICLLIGPTVGAAQSARPTAPAHSATGEAARHAPTTYYRDIAPLLQRACLGCHAPGRVGPFGLQTYPEARKHAALIAQVTAKRYMPPWLPAETLLSTTGGSPFLAHRALTQGEIDRLQQWVRDGTPEGERPVRTAAPRHDSGWRHDTGWRLGLPDLIVRMSGPFRLAAEGNEVCPSFVLPLNLPADRWVRAVDIRPSNAPAVRAVALFTDDSGTARRLAADGGPNGYFAFTAGLRDVAHRFSDWAPGGIAHTLPADAAMLLKRGSDLVLMLRCQPTGQIEEEQTEVGLYFPKAPPQRVPVMVALGATDIFLKANQTATVTDTLTLPVAAQALRVVPHAGRYCRTIAVTANLPDGTARSLLRIATWDPHWSEPYQWASPISLPAGTRLSLVATYDNTAANPINANHPLMSIQPSTEFMDESSGVQLQLIVTHPQEDQELRRALQSRGNALQVEKHGGQGHG